MEERYSDRLIESLSQMEIVDEGLPRSAESMAAIIVSLFRQRRALAAEIRRLRAEFGIVVE